MPRSRIEVVGYDGSETSRAALRLAARRAGPAGTVIAVYSAPPAPEPVQMPFAVPIPDAIPAETLEHARRSARAVLDDIEPSLFADTTVRTELVEARPARAIAEIADGERADEIVIGSRGHGPLRWMLGSVSHALLQHADRPLVVVPQDAVARAGRRAPGEPEVAICGYDGSPDARAALRYAADRLAAGSTIIAAYATQAPHEWQGAPYYDEALEQHTLRARALLDELDPGLAGAATLQKELVQGPPAAALADLARARDADEIVVGSRGLSPFRAALGSVAHALLHEADRPVVVVPLADAEQP